MTVRKVVTARSVALEVLGRIERDGAYANLALPPVLGASRLSTRDRAFATDLVYGTTRMRRALDFAIDRYVLSPPDPSARTLLRLGAYQLLFGGVPRHAAVGETVGLASPRVRGFVNAILRRVADNPVDWPDEATRLSVPDWIDDLLVSELGRDRASEALERMNEPPEVERRADGYVQNRASQWVADLVEARPGDRVLDVCAAPGGKATALAARGAFVVGADARPARAGLVAANARSTGTEVSVVVADGTQPPFTPESFDHVLLDAPCSGLGVLRRRPDARWRMTPDSVAELAALQQRLIDASAPLVRLGGTLTYSVCTLTSAESLAHRFPDGFEAMAAPGSPWETFGTGARLLPQAADTDGMIVLRYRRVS